LNTKAHKIIFAVTRWKALSRFWCADICCFFLCAD